VDKIVIKGGRRLAGSVRINGAKNSALLIMERSGGVSRFLNPVYNPCGIYCNFI